MSTPETAAAAVPVPRLVGDPTLEAPPRFLEEIPEGLLAEVKVPLAYRLAVPIAYDPRATAHRAAGSGQETSQVACIPFYKPVSRCLGGR